MSIPELTTPTTTAGDPDTTSTTGSGQVIMLKLHVGDVDDAEAFYHTVFGATLAVELGEGARVLTMAEGPGFILLEDGPDDEDTWNGSFLIQVPDLAVAEAAALDNGATRQQAFEGSPGGEQARSVDLLDPWGNQIEILQLG
ncbi:MAG: VOC family protein [Acidimicrobiales bacterium]